MAPLRIKMVYVSQPDTSVVCYLMGSQIHCPLRSSLVSDFDVLEHTKTKDHQQHDILCPILMQDVVFAMHRCTT